MKWSDSIMFSRPLRDVRLLSRAPAQDWNDFLREREQSAYDRGRAEGERTLSEQLLRQRNETVELQNGVLDSLRRVVPQVIHETENALINLALETAQKIVADIPVTTGMVEGVIREAVRQIEGTAEITIQLHPDDLALLRLHNSTVLNGLPETGALRFVGSSEVSRGGCLAQTRFGLIDARRETKIDQLRQTLNS